MFVSPSETTNYLTYIVKDTLKNTMAANTPEEILNMNSKIISDAIRERFIITTRLKCRKEMEDINKALKP